MEITEADSRAVGRRIRSLREGHDLTQKALADLCYVSQPAVSAWERGAKVPSKAAQFRLSDVLHSSRSVLFHELVRAEQMAAA